MFNIYLASKQEVKINALEKVLRDRDLHWNIVPCDAKSGVSNQPFGLEEIRRGALNRLNCVDKLPVLSLETGIIKCTDEEGAYYEDITCCVLKTRYGLFEAWSEPHPYYQFQHFTDKPVKWDGLQSWLALPEEDKKNITAGSLIYEKYKSSHTCITPNNWYGVNIYNANRKEYMSKCIIKVFYQLQSFQETLPLSVIPASCVMHNGVPFLDIQEPLIKHSRELMFAVKRLTDCLLFDTVVALDARGFLLISQFAREGYPIVMARKKGKLPSKDLLMVEYQKEYGTDTLCITKDAIKKGARVIIIDDVIATGGSMLAVEKLVIEAGGKVIAFVASYVIEKPDGELLCDNQIKDKLRFLCTQTEASENKTTIFNFHTYINHIYDIATPPDRILNGYVAITPPSLKSLTVNLEQMEISFGRFRYSSNIWFKPKDLKDKDVLLFLNPSNHREMMDVLQLLKILYRKSYKSLTVVIPFLEQSTQDRVEYRDDFESLALVDCVNKLIGKNKVITFDLHAEQSKTSFHNLDYLSLVKGLWYEYNQLYPESIPVFPDDGAHKRFSKLAGVKNEMVFRKKRDGDKRIIATDDKVVGEHYVIIDDLVRSGGTMNSVAKYLLANGAKKVDCLFAHAPFEPTTGKNLEVFNDVWTSNSCPQNVPVNWVKINVVDVLEQHLLE